MSKSNENQEKPSDSLASHLDTDQWIFDCLSLFHKRREDILQNPNAKLKEILEKIPSSGSIEYSDPLVCKGLTAIKDFLKRCVVEEGKAFDGDIPSKIHHLWINFDIAYEEMDLDKQIGRDPTANLRVFIDLAKELNEQFIK